MQRQATFLNALSDEAKARLDRGEYPPYHLINAARRSAGVPAETAKNWLLAFLYRRARSHQLADRPDAEPDRAPDRGGRE